MSGCPCDLSNLAEISTQNEAGQISLMDWASLAVGASGYSPAAHHRLLLHWLSAVSRGETDRLMVLMPPGSAKSTYVSVNTDLWGAYVSTPATAGTWYAWVEGTDGSAQTVYPTPFLVT
jgi:hypothetical protein